MLQLLSTLSTCFLFFSLLRVFCSFLILFIDLFMFILFFYFVIFKYFLFIFCFLLFFHTIFYLF